MKIILVVFALLPLIASAQGSARDNFLRQQAYAEMQRVSGQIDTLQSGVEDLRGRLEKLEQEGNGEAALRAEIDSLRSAVAELRQELANQRTQIVKELSERIANMPTKMPSEPVSQPAITGPTSTYTVQSGDSLYLISKAFGTTVSKIMEMNQLKSDRLQIGQKLIVPQK